MRYTELRSRLKTGDIVLFSGRGFVSWLIRLITWSEWSHVGMVIRGHLLGQDMVLCWESTTRSSVADANTGKRRDGVQLIPLRSRVCTYKGRIGVRQLKTRLTIGGERKLVWFYQRVKNRPYEGRWWEPLKAALPARNKRKQLDQLFCSEMVAEALMVVGRLPDGDAYLPSNEYTPADFAGRSGMINAIMEGTIIDVCTGRGS